MRSYTKPLLAILATALFASPSHAAESWDMPMAYNDANYHTINGKLFAEAVDVCTGGELKITVHGGGSLYKGNEIKRAVQTGQAQIGERLLSAHANENAVFGFDSVPFMATSFADSEKLKDAADAVLTGILDKQNLVMLYSVPWPPQGLYFKQAVDSVSAMKGIKFRSYNAATARLAELSGMVPVQIEAAELVQALATGVADSFVSSGSTGYDKKVWEHLSHFYDAQAWLPRNTVFANKKAFDALPAPSQNCLKSSALLAGVAGT
ncbi:MAG: TRAP transporter substrate-binding protein, partial [bacterium]